MKRKTVMHVVFYSGGLGSWATAKHVIETHGPDNVTLLFTDTLGEDPDLYRFLDDTEKDFGIPITRLADGRTIWEVFKDKRLLGNSRIAPCSHELKQKPARKWIEQNCDPATTILYVGIDWSETHRLPSVVRGWDPYTIQAPLTDPPYLDKQAIRDLLEESGIALPQLYVLGYAHNNFGGGCVRAGHGQFLHMLETRPEVYAEWEANENAMREFLDRNVSILRDRTGGVSKPLPLSVLRQRGTGDRDDIGGCGCFIDAE